MRPPDNPAVHTRHSAERPLNAVITPGSSPACHNQDGFAEQEGTGKMTTLTISHGFTGFEGKHAMSETTSPKAIYQAYKEDDKKGPLAGPLFVARIVAIVAAIGGAVPTAMNLYQSWRHNIPYNQVSHRLAQYDLWMKNFDCQVNYRALNVNQGTRVDVGACNRSGDVAIKITAPNGKAAYEWIAFDQLQKAGAAFSFMNLIATSAHADEAPKSGAPMTLAQAGAPAAGGMQVKCQVMPAKGQILRIVQEGNKCFREDFSAFKGKVEKREEVPCSTQCGPGKG